MVAMCYFVWPPALRLWSVRLAVIYSISGCLCFLICKVVPKLIAIQISMMLGTALLVGIIFLQTGDDFGGVQDRCVHRQHLSFVIHDPQTWCNVFWDCQCSVYEYFSCWSVLERETTICVSNYIVYRVSTHP